MIWLRALTALLLGGSVLAPQLLGTEQAPSPTATDVVLLVDRTTSMGAQDHSGTKPRMDGVALDIAEIVAALPEARYTVLTADNEARIAAPWTTDTAAVVTLGKTLGWREEGYGTGSDIAVGAPLALAALEESRSSRPESARFLFYFGDGEQIAPHEPASFGDLAPLVDGAWVLGYGTDEGGSMRRRVDSPELVTRGGEPQVSRIDEERLRTIAGQLGGQYTHRASPGGLSLPERTAAPIGDVAPTSGRVQLGVLLAGLAAVVLAADGALTARQSRRLRDEVKP